MRKHLPIIALLLALVTCWNVLAETPEPTQTAVPSETPAEAAAEEPSPSPTPAPTPTLAPNETFDSDPSLILHPGDSSDEVILLQNRLRDLGYFNYKITNYYGELTKEAVAAFQKQNGLSADGIAGPDTYNVLFNNSAKRAPIKEVIKPTPKPTQNTSNTGTKKKSKNSFSNGVPIGTKKDWWSWVSKRFTRGDKAVMYDVDTGLKINVIMVGGHNHADVEPATKDDTAKLKKAYGGTWSWDRRAVVVKIDGVWCAASINGMPHGYETVAGNGMDGQVCIHFLNSKTHVRNLPDKAHQSMVRKAAGE